MSTYMQSQISIIHTLTHTEIEERKGGSQKTAKHSCITQITHHDIPNRNAKKMDGKDYLNQVQNLKNTLT